MNRDIFKTERFPRVARYNPEWIMSSVGSGTNWLWLAEWLAEALDLKSGMRVLDLGCGRATSSIFLAREFGLQVWAADLWFDPSENFQRVQDAGVADRVFPLRADARALPFAAEFFDVIVSIDSYVYFGTDDLFLQSLARFMKPGGQLGMAGAGLTREIGGAPPEHLREWAANDGANCLHSAEWWRRHWERSGLVEVERADTMPDGWRWWLDWQKKAAPQNLAEIQALEADGGEYLGYTRVTARRRPGLNFGPAVISVPFEYSKQPLLRSEGRMSE